MPVEEIAIEDLVLDSEVNIRTELDEETVLRYMEFLDELPPGEVVRLPDGSNVLTDGFHRTEATARKGGRKVKCEVLHGDHAFAVQRSALANLKHGLPLTTDELEEAIYRLQLKPPHGPGLSQRQIATATGFTQKRVWTLLKHYEAKMTGPAVPQVVAAAVARAPADVRPHLQAVAAEQGWSTSEVRAVVRELEREGSVADVLADARPHLTAMRERLGYVRMVDAALFSFRQLDSVGVTPERLVMMVDDPQTWARWREQLAASVVYLQRVQKQMDSRKGLRMLEGGDGA